MNTRIGPDLREIPVEEEDFDDEWACTWCGGDGTMENDDPVFYGHNRDVPCSACGGTGERKNQTIF
jgi:DnaJ-class molecular chaperone